MVRVRILVRRGREGKEMGEKRLEKIRGKQVEERGGRRGGRRKEVGSLCHLQAPALYPLEEWSGKRQKAYGHSEAGSSF